LEKENTHTHRVGQAKPHIRGGNRAEAVVRSVTTLKNEFNSYVVVVKVSFSANEL